MRGFIKTLKETLTKDIIIACFCKTMITMIIFELISSLAILIDGIMLAHFLGDNAD